MKTVRGRLRFYALVLAVAAVAALGGAFPTAAQISTLQPPQSCDDPGDQISLFAKRLGKRRIGYGLTPRSASVPGPTIEMTEGDCVAINLVNDTNVRLSFHPHGVDYSVHSDGTAVNASCVPPGRARTYVISAHSPQTRADGTIDPGSAGYWHYHDHCIGAHGTGGINRGLFGALIVRRPGDPLPARSPFVVFFKDITVNLRKAPRTPMFRANIGERVEFVVIGHGELFHTFHLHGHRWADTRTGLPQTLNDSDHLLDNKTVGPADSFGFQVVAGEHVGQGAWMYHCHVQSHSDLGMVGLFVVRGPDGKMNQQTRNAVRRWKRIERGHRRG